MLKRMISLLLAFVLVMGMVPTAAFAQENETAATAQQSEETPAQETPKPVESPSQEPPESEGSPSQETPMSGESPVGDTPKPEKYAEVEDSKSEDSAEEGESKAEGSSGQEKPQSEQTPEAGNAAVTPEPGDSQQSGNNIRQEDVQQSETPVEEDDPNLVAGQCGRETEEGQETNDVTWIYNLETKTLTLSGKGETADAQYDEEYDIYTAPWDAYSLELEELVVEEGVTAIGAGLFAEAVMLSKVTLPEGLKTIGAHAFRSCEALKELALPDTLEAIGSEAFLYCIALTEVTLPETTVVAEDAFLESGIAEDEPVEDEQKEEPAEEPSEPQGVQQKWALQKSSVVTFAPAEVKEVKTETVSIVAQHGGDLLMPPQTAVEVSSDLAESYGYTDSVTNGVSGLDVLVKAHEAMFGENFTKTDASAYLVVSNNLVSTMFGIEDSNICFMIDGRQPNNGKGTGYAIPQAPVKSGDTVEFAFYQDTTAWSDNYVWLELEDGTKLDGQSVSAGATVNVVVKGYSPFSYGYLPEETLQANIASIPGAKLALVDMGTGALTDLNVTTDESGNASLFVPRDYANSTRVLTAYGDYMMMSLAEVSVGEAIAETVLTGLEIAVGGGTMDDTTEQTLTPAFSGDTMSYSTPILDYVEDSNSRFVWVKATAPEGATLTAKCGSSDVATLTSGEWTKLQEAGGYWWDPTYSGCLKTGTYNKVKITLSAEGQDDMVYTVTVPMQPDTANQSLTWKTNLKSAIYYTTNAEGACLSVEAQHQNRPLDNEDVITYQWYRNSTASTEGSTAIAGAAAAVYAPSTAVAGTTYYYAVATCGELDPITSNVIAVTVTEEAAPTSVTLVCDYPYTVPDTWVKALGGVDYVATIGDELTIRAVDENGKDTPVAWSVSAYGGNFNQDTGKYTIKTTSYTYLTAVSLYDSSITSGEKAICVKDYTIPSIRRNQSVALSTDGQTQKTAFVNGGVEGHTIWVNTIPKGVADCTTDLTQKGSSVYFNLLRPGIINVSYALDLGGEDDPVLGDSTTLTVTGVAVEDSQGKLGKTYLELTGENKAPTAQLTAYLMEGCTVASWSSADEAVATVDENGLVTGHAIGSTIITVTDSEGTTGGIKVVVTDADKPTFENIAFTVDNMWSNGIKTQITFKPETTAYTGLELTRYQASSLDLTADTLYNTEKLTAVATYTDSNGEAATVDVNSGVATKLPNIPFGTSTVTITLTDKLDAEKKTDYTFEVTRPRDTTQQIYNTTGIVVKNAEGGALSADQYKEQAEGYLFRANSDGTIKNAYTVDYRELYYRAYLLDARPSFTMLTKGNSAYVHMRYSVDEGATWKVLPQGGGSSDVITFPEPTGGSNPVVKIILQVVSDKTYVDGGNAFPETVTTSNGTTYTVWAEQLPSADAVKMLTATVDTGDWYPAFDPDVTNYKISVANGSAAPVLTYTIAAGTKATIGEEIQTPNEDGSYTLALTTSAQTVTITSSDGSIRRQYSFAYFERIANGADKVVDYLAVNSQYTNSGQFGLYPEYTLGSNSLNSLGNFGGYITYYFADGLTDDPANQYGVDFYINGNAFKDTSTGTGLGSMEPGQVWVSEDGSAWYALAGSEHYDADTLWDYTVTYSKNGTGTSWSDNYGNSNTTVGRSFSWPLAENYPLNALAKQDSFALTGILIPSVKGITGNDEFGTYSSGARFGYVDTLVNGTANPYAENDTYQNASSGFDLAWAVDAAGNPVDVSGKSFHYVKVVTASNIVAGSANEKSTEVANITRASAQDAAVGVTAAPTSITFSEGDTTYQLPLVQGQQVYEVALPMRNVSIAVNGSEGDNIYINNQRVASGTAATGFTVDFAGETLVRVIVQNGDQEPVIYLLKLTAKLGAEYAPEITKQPASAGYIVGETMVELSVEAVVQAQDGALSYQWFKNTENSTEGGTAIPNAVNAAYAPGKASEAGTNYYYCVVTSTAGEGSLSTASEVAEITVITAQDAAGKVLSGSGTEADPWQIRDAQDYQDVYDLVARGVSFSGQYLKQMKDITLPEGWESIGVRIDPGISHINRGQNMAAFSGTLDGSGRTVTVPEGGHPLFGYVKDAYVQNLNIYGKQIAGYGLVDHLEGVGLSGNAITIDNVTLKSGSSTLKSGLIGTYITTNGYAGCSADFYVTIRNCTIEKDVVIGYDKDQSMIGSIAGRVHGTIENCVSYATVYGTNYVGGILGTRDNAMGTCSVTGCTFAGTVEATGEHVGGIVGGGYENSTAPNGTKVTVNNNKVNGSVTGKDKVGGILGGDSYVAQAWDAYSFKVNTFKGTVSATGGTYVGGIIGYYKSLNKIDDIISNYYSPDCGAGKGIGFVQYIDTNSTVHETESGATYFNTKTSTDGCPQVNGCWWKTDHNRTDDPMGADAAKLCYTYVEVTGITLNQKTAELTLGGNTLTLTATVTPENATDKAVTWTSSNESVATVVDGVVTAAAVGEAVITAKAGMHEASCAVAVVGRPICYEIKVSGSYQTEYTVGDALNLDGIKLTARWTNGEETELRLSDVTISGFDNNKSGTQRISLSYGLGKAEITVTVKPISSKITVSVSILGDSEHGRTSTPHGLARGGLTTWVSVSKVEADTSETVWDVLQRVAQANGITFVADSSNKYGTVYISAVNGLGEFDNGPNSGWMYTVNGTHPEVGVSVRYVKNGDKIVLHYTDDYTYEEGGNNYGKNPNSTGTNGSTGTTSSGTTTASDQTKAKNVINLINKIPTTVTKNSKSAIEAARKAYDALTDTQKKLVTNYDKLTKAEVAYAKLTATDADKQKAKAVSDLIAKLGTITADSETDVKAARKAYEALTDVQKLLVENMDVLEKAESKLALLKAQGGENPYQAAGDYLETLGTPGVGSIGGEWMVLGLARSGRKIANVESYYASVVKYVQENIDENGRLHSAKSTENSRLILALTSLGYDVTDVAGYNLLTGLSSMDFVCKQGINGPIWALIALDSGNYPAPGGRSDMDALMAKLSSQEDSYEVKLLSSVTPLNAGSDVTRGALIQCILDAQTPDGGWAIAGEEADSDMTGMALTALAPYYEISPAVKTAVDKAVATLSRVQNDDGGFSTFGSGGKVATSESVSQVIVALSALGIDADTDSRFVKNGFSALDALLSYAVAGGGFKHIATGELDGMATEQGYYALTAYNRFLEKKTSLYNMTDVVDMGGDPVEAPTELTVPAVTEPTEAEPARNSAFPWLAMVLVLVVVCGVGALTVAVIIPKFKKKD